MADNWLWETSTTQSIVSVGQLPLLGPARVRHVAGSIMASPESPERCTARKTARNLCTKLYLDAPWEERCVQVRHVS